MTDDAVSEGESLPIAVLEQIDRVCLEFEAVWRRGEVPKLEDYLGDLHGLERSQLLRELLLLELDYRSQHNEQPTPDEYQARFPRDSRLVSDVFEQVSTGAALAETTPTASAHVSCQQALPAHFGNYELLDVLGEGGMGVVYRARQHTPDRVVALKVVRPDRLATTPPDQHEKAMKRLWAEAQAAAQLEHENIVPVYDLGEVDGQPFFSMRYVEGRRLDEVLHDGPLDGRGAVALLGPVARAVDYAHGRNVIHRDIKPRNILLDTSGRPYVADFGLAKSFVAAQELTGTQEVVGTPAYMSPEQSRGPAGVDHRTDVYSLGATLYELLTGRPPFRAATPVETQRQVIENEPVPPRQLNPAVARDLETVCLKCLRKDPDERYRSAQELAAELGRFSRGEPTQARPLSFLGRMAKWCRRNQTVAILTAIAATLLMILAIGGPIVAVNQASLRGQAERHVQEKARLLRELESTLGDLKEQQGLTEDEAEKARTEAAISQAVLEFLNNDLLGAADPQREPERDIKFRTVVDRAAQQIEERFGDQPLVEAAVRSSLGQMYLYLGAFEEAEAHYIRARNLALAQRGPEHPETLSILGNLALVYKHQGRLKEAEQLLNEVLEIKAGTLGPEHPSTLTSTHNLATVYVHQGRFDKAERLLNHALEVARRRLGPEHWRTLGSMQALSVIHKTQGRLKEAEQLLDELLAIETRVLGADHLTTLLSVHSLASVYIVQGRADDAERLLEAVLEVARRTPGPEHPRTLGYMHELAMCYRNQGRLKEAEQVNLDVLEMRRRILGPEHPDTLDGMHNLAMVYVDQGRLEEAEELNRKVLEVRRRIRAPDHPDTLKSIHNLAVVRSAQGRPAEAEKLLNHVLEVELRMLGPRHPSTLKCMNDLAVACARQGRLAEAEKLLKESLEIEGRVLGPEHLTTLMSIHSLAAVYKDQERLQEAEELSLKVLKVYRRKLSLEHPNTQLTLRLLYQLAQECNAQGLFEAAARLYAEVLKTDPAHLKASDELAWLLANCEDPEIRNPQRAVGLATKALERAPETRRHWSTLGLAHYRAGDWSAAIAALEKATKLRSGNCLDWFILAMAHWQLGHEEEARAWYFKTVSRMEQNGCRNPEHHRFAREAAALLALGPPPPSGRSTTNDEGPHQPPTALPPQEDTPFQAENPEEPLP
jgi:tetratricopeptide (TPR) repeat protein/predicted Ser/Thr protein kinase